jgi:hypothetical protein
MTTLWIYGGDPVTLVGRRKHGGPISVWRGASLDPGRGGEGFVRVGLTDEADSWALVRRIWWSGGEKYATVQIPVWTPGPALDTP